MATAAMTPQDAQKLRQAQALCERLKQELLAAREKKRDKALDKSAIAATAAIDLRPRRTLKGHGGKVYCVDWASRPLSGDNPNPALVSCSNDGHMIVWGGMLANKEHNFPLPTCWVLTCAFSAQGDLVCAGGLDNLVYVYSARTGAKKPVRELYAHDGFVSGCKFSPSGRLLTSCSGDTTCSTFDVETGQVKRKYHGHGADVTSLALAPSDGENLFITGSADCTVKLWDARLGKSVCTFYGHERDVNALSFHPSGTGFVSGSDDSVIKYWDVRAVADLTTMNAHDTRYPEPLGVCSVSLSASGRFAFASYGHVQQNERCNVEVWDVYRGERNSHVDTGHTQRVASVSMSRDGFALATASWDSSVKIHA